jgi:CBS domain-containing protein
MRTVQDILNTKQKAFNVIQSDKLVIDALNMLNSVNLSYLIVMEGEEYKGIFSERDYSRNVILKGRSSSTSTVAEVMTRDVPVVDVSETVESCMNTMERHRTRYLLAFDENEKFQGVITIHDLLRQVIANKEQVFDYDIAKKLIDRDESNRIY